MRDDNSELIPRDSGTDDAVILREAVAGRPVREIAKLRGMTTAQVNDILDREAQKAFSGEGTRRAVMLEAQRLDHLKQALWRRYMAENDNASAALFIKASERLASMLGWNHPQGHVVQLTGHLPVVERETSTERLARVLAELCHEPLPDADEELPTPPN